MKSYKILLIQIIFFTQTSYPMQNLFHRPNIPSPWEQNYINKRLEKEKETIINFISTREIKINKKNTNKKEKNKEYNEITKNLTNDHIPTIAVIGSGGGMRAHLAFLGTMLALQKINLLNGIRYASTLSGSTWMLGTFLAWAKLMNGNLNLDNFADYVKARSGESLLDGDDVKDIDDIIGKIAVKIANKETVQPSDIWGMVIMHRLMSTFGGNEHDITFNDLRILLNTTNIMPFPIFTSVITNDFDNNHGEYQWLEVNPYTTGCPYLGCFITTNYFESKFRNFNIQKSYPESSLGEFLGLFGSAYSVTSQDASLHTESLGIDIVNKILNKISHLPLYGKIINIDLTKERLLKAKMNNFSRGIDGTNLEHEKTLTLVDAGMHFNLPFPPLFTMSRNIDIYIVCDASAGSGKHPQLDCAAKYAYKNNIPFPTLNNPENYRIETNRGSFSYSIFKEDEKPTIIYFKNPISRSTIDFTYNKNEFNEIVGTMSEIVLQATQSIKKEITNKIGNCYQESYWANGELSYEQYPENNSSLGFFASIASKIDKLLGSCIKSLRLYKNS